MEIKDDRLFLRSGGGSALLPLPIDVLSLEDKCQIVRLLQSKGADIQELNTVRQSMSQLKNGGFARMAKATTVSASVSSLHRDSLLQCFLCSTHKRSLP